jgi:hypothetical protein
VGATTAADVVAVDVVVDVVRSDAYVRGCTGGIYIVAAAIKNVIVVTKCSQYKCLSIIRNDKLRAELTAILKIV